MVKCANHRAGVVVAAIAAIGLLAMPASAEAAIYIWNVDASGSWTTPSNWLYAGGGPNGGYPNAAGDQAFFTGEYTAARTVTIPANVTVTVGTIYFGGPVAISVVGAATSRLALDNGSAAAQVVTTSASTFALNVVTLLRSSLLTTVNQGGTLNLDRLLEDGGVRSVTKRGSGRTALNQLNSYTGLTRVEQGVLSASAAAGGALPGNLEIGTGASPATFRTAGGTQLQPTATIDVRAGGLLQVDSAETVRHLRIADGRVEAVAQFIAQELTMTGGVLETIFLSPLPALVTATSSSLGPATISLYVNAPANAAFDLRAFGTTLLVNDGPGPVDLEIAARLSGAIGADLIKEGSGTLRLTGTLANTFAGQTLVREGALELARDGAVAIAGALHVGFGPRPARVAVLRDQNIVSDAVVSVGASGTLDANGRQASFRELAVHPGGFVSLAGSAALTTTNLTMTGGHISLPDATGRLVVRGDITASSSGSGTPAIDGAGGIALSRAILLGGGYTPLVVADGSQPIDLRVGVTVQGVPTAGLVKLGPGVVLFERTSTVDTALAQGTLLVTGAFGSGVTMTGGALGGTGTVGAIIASASRLAPGLSPGRLTTGAVRLDPSSRVEIELSGTTAGTGYDQLDVRGAVSLDDAPLALTVGFTPPPDSRFTIIANDAADPVAGTFTNLPEGGTIRAGGQTFAITYRGGDGNDVVLTAVTSMTYFLAEGATGAFFDDDVLIANPNDRDAPVTLTFLKEGGNTVVAQRVVPAMGRVTVPVDQIPGLESTAASVKVVSDGRVSLVVERTMFWDASYYGGHTANAVPQPETRWIFAEGFQGFFDTYILIANAEATPTTATLTFLREGDTPFVTTIPVGAFARRTVYAGDYPELRGRAFGIVVEAAQPVIAERAMYFASQPGRLWAGGHVNTGVVTPSRSWFHAEGATGGYFSTFILLSNPQDTAANVELRFLLDTGAVITRQKTIAAQQRLTVNPAAEGDRRLENAAVSTVVQSDVPIVSERSMYWPGEAVAFGEGHNSTGVSSLATRWGLAEGRLGGPHAFDTYILLANPSTQAAEVTITYLFPSDTPIVRRHTVPATSRFNVDVKASLPELRGEDAAFGALIEVTNSVPIAVERSLYWNANGVFWAGGSNALGTPLP